MVKTKLGMLTIFSVKKEENQSGILNLKLETEIYDELLAGFESLYIVNEKQACTIYPLSTLDKDKGNVSECSYSYFKVYFNTNILNDNQHNYELSLIKETIYIPRIYNEEIEVKDGNQKGFGKFTKVVDVKKYEINQIRSFDIFTSSLILEYFLKDGKSQEAKFIFFSLNTNTFLFKPEAINLIAKNVLLPEIFHIHPNLLVNNIQTLNAQEQTEKDQLKEYEWIEQVQQIPLNDDSNLANLEAHYLILQNKSQGVFNFKLFKDGTRTIDKIRLGFEPHRFNFNPEQRTLTCIYKNEGKVVLIKLNQL